MGPIEEVSLRFVETFEDAEELVRWMAQPRPVLGLDTETGGLDWWSDELRMIQVGDEMTGWSVPFPLWGGLMVDLLSRYDGPIVLHNAKFDGHFLRRHAGYVLPWHRVHDTVLMTKLVDPLKPASLKATADRWVDRRLSGLQTILKKGMSTNKWTWASVPSPFEPYWQYAALDPVLTARVAAVLWPRVQPYRRLYDQEVALEELLTQMEARGVAVDRAYCETEMHRLLARAEEMADSIEREWGISPGSNQQLAEKLEETGAVIHQRTPKGKPKVDEELLSMLDHPLAASVLEFRGVIKVANTYLRNFLKYSDATGRVHCSVNQVAARTGRMSVSRPSLQNIPRTRLARWAFTAAEGNKLVAADFEQIEMRLLAHYAQEEKMIEAILGGVDLHSFTARQAYGVAEPTKKQRQVAKHSNFAILYGAGPARFSKTAGISLAEGRQFLDMYARAFPGVKRFTQAVRQQGQRRLFEEGEAFVTTWGGRRLPANPDKIFTLVNYLIQGSARDVMGARMLQMASAGLDEYMTLPVHDEVLMDVPEGLVEDVVETTRAVMPDNDNFAVPIGVDVEVKDRWGEGYE